MQCKNVTNSTIIFKKTNSFRSGSKNWGKGGKINSKLNSQVYNQKLGIFYQEITSQFAGQDIIDFQINDSR